MDFNQHPDPSFYAPDVFIYSPFDPPPQPAALTRQIPKKLISDEFIDLSFLLGIPEIPLTEDQGVIKYLVQEGEPLLLHQDPPKLGSLFHVRYEGRKLTGEVVDKFRDRNEIRKLKLGKENYIDGFNIALASMRRKEISWFRFQPKYHYYSNEMKELRTNCDGETMAKADEALLYKIEVIDFKNLEKLENDDFDGRINKLEETRIKGKELYKSGSVSAALKQYTKGLGIVKSFPKTLFESMNEEQLVKFRYYHAIMHSNTILCKMKEKKWYEALRLCEDGMSVNPKDLKLLYLKGQCNLNISNYDLSFSCFQEILLLDPNNKEVEEMLEYGKQKKKEEEICEKNRYRKVFEKMNEEEIIELEEMKKRRKLKKIEDSKNVCSFKKEVALDVVDQNENDDYLNNIPLSSLIEGMVIDTTEEDNMFSIIDDI